MALIFPADYKFVIVLKKNNVGARCLLEMRLPTFYVPHIHTIDHNGWLVIDEMYFIPIS